MIYQNANNMNIKIKDQHIDTIIGRMVQLRKMVDHHNSEIKPFMGEMEEWERKEYYSIFDGYKKDIEQNAVYMMQNESDFNLILCDYNLSVAIFINLIKN